MEDLGLTLDMDLKLEEPALRSSSCMEISMREGSFKETPLIILPERFSAIAFWIFSILSLRGSAAN
jgi:hypothetical protein